MQKIDLKKDYKQKTPLHFACKHGYIHIVQFLIEKGADIEAKDKNQNTPLYFASSKGHDPVVQYLIDHGAKIDAN